MKVASPKRHHASRRAYLLFPAWSFLGAALLLTALHQLKWGIMLHPTSSSTLSDWSTSWSNGHFKRKAVRTSAQPGFQEAFATLFALEMQDLLGIKEDGPLPPKGTRHDLGDVVRGLKVGAASCSDGIMVDCRHYRHWRSC